MARLAQYWKGILGFITPGVVALGVAVSEDSAGKGDITRTEWVGIVLAMLLTGGLVTIKRNGPSDDPTTSTPMRVVPREQGYGAFDVLVIVAVVLLILVLLMFLFGRV